MRVEAGLRLAQVRAPHQLFMFGEGDRWASSAQAVSSQRRPPSQHRVGRRRAPTATSLGPVRIAPAIGPGGHGAWEAVG